MFKNFKSGIVASVIAVTIATAGITTVSSFTFVPEAQAWSLKGAFKKSTSKVTQLNKHVRAIGRKVVPSEIRDTAGKIKNIPNWRFKPVTDPNRHDHRKPGTKPRVTRR